MGGEDLQRSQNFSVSKSKVEFDFTTVRTRIIPIMKHVQVGDYPAKINRTYGWSKQHVSYYLNKLEKEMVEDRSKISVSYTFFKKNTRQSDNSVPR